MQSDKAVNRFSRPSVSLSRYRVPAVEVKAKFQPPHARKSCILCVEVKFQNNYFYLIINVVLITRMIIMSGDLSMTLFNYTVCPKNMDTPE